MKTIHAILEERGLSEVNPGVGMGDAWRESSGDLLESVSPIEGRVIAKVQQASAHDYEHVTAQTDEAFLRWRMMPAPRRGELVRQIGNAVRARKRKKSAIRCNLSN